MARSDYNGRGSETSGTTFLFAIPANPIFYTIGGWDIVVCRPPHYSLLVFLTTDLLA